MKIKRFLAATSREALREVRETLGSDAVVLSNRQTANGVEVMALANADMSSLMADTSLEKKTVTPPVGKAILKTEDAGSIHQQPEIPGSFMEKSVAQGIISEIQSMRGMLQDQLMTMSWGNMARHEPARLKMLHTMLGAGFSPLLSRQFMDNISDAAEHTVNFKKIMTLLMGDLQTAAEDDMIEQGGVYALVGPTGIGKTTTAAKLAARCVVRHGADATALLTTDSYRIGGHEQLRIYGKLLGVPVRSIRDADDLQLTLSELENKHLVLIDSAGMSQRDKMVAEQMAVLANNNASSVRKIRHILLLNATCSGNTLEDVVGTYQKEGIDGCIITKVDEAVSLGVVLDIAIRHKLLVNYITNGQRVPEDIHAANPRYLIHRAFKSGNTDTAFTLQDTEFALLMAGSHGVTGYMQGLSRTGVTHD